jgi:hypothetical protein
MGGHIDLCIGRAGDASWNLARYLHMCQSRSKLLEQPNAMGAEAGGSKRLNVATPGSVQTASEWNVQFNAIRDFSSLIS